MATKMERNRIEIKTIQCSRKEQKVCEGFND